MWVPDTYEAAATPFVAWLSVAPKAAGFAVLLRIFVERAGPTAALWAGAAALLGRADDRGRQPDGDPPDRREAAARLLRDRPHRLHAARRGGAVRRRAWRCCSSTWWPTCSRTWAPSWSWRPWPRPRARPRSGAFRGLAQRSPALALAMLLFLLSLGGHPVRGGVLGQALRPLGGGPGGALRAGAAGGGADRGGALLLPPGRQADVHRRPGPAHAGARSRRRSPSCSSSAPSRSCCWASIPGRCSTRRCARPRRCSDAPPAGRAHFFQRPST